MIKKEELLKRIRAIDQSEESVISIYSTHIQNVLRYSNIDEAVQNRVLETLRKLNADLKEHKEITSRLIDSIVKSGKDVY